jgi:hypothetical protein
VAVRMAVSSVLANREGERRGRRSNGEAIKCYDILARIATVAATACTLQGSIRRWEAVGSAYYNNDRNVNGTSNYN